MKELNYFDCRGRVQAIRNYLNEHDIAFVDRRVSLDDGFQEWSLLSKDPHVSGAFALLPTMRLIENGELLSETLVIAFALDPNMTDQERMMTSSAYNDVIQNIGVLIWGNFAFVGCDLKASGDVMFGRMTRLFNRWENSPLLDKRDAKFFSLAQHFVGEAIDAARYAFQGRMDELLTKCPRLAAFDERYQATISSRFPRPNRFTGRPDERDAIKLINATR